MVIFPHKETTKLGYKLKKIKTYKMYSNESNQTKKLHSQFKSILDEIRAYIFESENSITSQKFDTLVAP